MSYYAVLLVFSLVTLILSSVIMAKLNSQTNFPNSSSASQPKSYGTMKTADYIMIFGSVVLLCWSAFQLYNKGRSSLAAAGSPAV